MSKVPDLFQLYIMEHAKKYCRDHNIEKMDDEDLFVIVYHDGAIVVKKEKEVFDVEVLPSPPFKSVKSIKEVLGYVGKNIENGFMVVGKNQCITCPGVRLGKENSNE